MTAAAASISLLALCTACAATTALAENPVGFYVGAGGGESHIRAEEFNPAGGFAGADGSFEGNNSAWTAAAGIRPIAPLGVELSYIDFGNSSRSLTDGAGGGLTGAEAKAAALFGLGYLPLPVPFMSLYGKLGVARLDTTLTELGPVPSCPVEVTPCVRSTSRQATWSTNFAYGAGVQGTMGALAIRAEYVRISANGVNPDILSLGVTWTF